MRVGYLLMLCLIFTFCARCKPGIDKGIIPGTYTQYTELHHDEDSFTRLFDTLDIQSSGKEVYNVIRRYRTFKTVDGRALEPEYKTRRWTGDYREKSQTILVNETGKVITFYPESDAITLGGVSYKKME